MSVPDGPRSFDHRLQEWVGQEVVVDCAAPYLAVGTLAATHEAYVELTDADMHDLRDSDSTRDAYLVKTGRYGITANRKRLVVRGDQIVGVSLLADVVVG